MIYFKNSLFLKLIIQIIKKIITLKLKILNKINLIKNVDAN